MLNYIITFKRIWEMLISVLFCYCIVIHEGILELYVNLTKTLSGNDLSFS